MTAPQTCPVTPSSLRLGSPGVWSKVTPHTSRRRSLHTPAGGSYRVGKLFLLVVNQPRPLNPARPACHIPPFPGARRLVSGSCWRGYRGDRALWGRLWATGGRVHRSVSADRQARCSPDSSTMGSGSS